MISTNSRAFLKSTNQKIWPLARWQARPSTEVFSVYTRVMDRVLAAQTWAHGQVHIGSEVRVSERACAQMPVVMRWHWLRLLHAQHARQEGVLFIVSTALVGNRTFDAHEAVHLLQRTSLAFASPKEKAEQCACCQQWPTPAQPCCELRDAVLQVIMKNKLSSKIPPSLDIQLLGKM
eukprot:2065634-Amphidinium_carterae.1